MDKRGFLEKLKSRKLWAAIAGLVVGIAAAFGMDENALAQVSGIVTAAASVVAYIIGESAVDASHVAENVISAAAKKQAVSDGEQADV